MATKDKLMPAIIVTTSRRPTAALKRQASEWAERLSTSVVPRTESIRRLCETHGADGVLVVSQQRITYFEPATGIEYFFHPGMAKVRIHNIEAGHGDPMVRAMELQAADELLDCTVGRASDAIVATYVIGAQGRVLGLERVPVIAQLTIHGLATCEYSGARFTELLRRVEVLQADHREYLPTCADDSFDVVYFDPIFHAPVKQSEAMKPLRALADKATITADVLAQALRVSRRCVVIKQRYGTPLWAQLGITDIRSATGSRIEYGVIRPG